MRKTPFYVDFDYWQFSAYCFFNFCSIGSQDHQMFIQRCIQGTLQPQLDCMSLMLHCVAVFTCFCTLYAIPTSLLLNFYYF